MCVWEDLDLYNLTGMIRKDSAHSPASAPLPPGHQVDDTTTPSSTKQKKEMQSWTVFTIITGFPYHML